MKSIWCYKILISLVFLTSTTTIFADIFASEENDELCNFPKAFNTSDHETTKNESTKHNNSEYIRKCLCKTKNCIRFCCQHGQVIKNRICVEHETHDIFLNTTINHEIKDKNDYNIIYGKPCKKMMMREPDDEPADEWILIEVSLSNNISVFTSFKFYLNFMIKKNGSIHLPVLKEVKDLDDYCLTKIIDDRNNINTFLLTCFIKPYFDLRFFLYTIG